MKLVIFAKKNKINIMNKLKLKFWIKYYAHEISNIMHMKLVYIYFFIFYFFFWKLKCAW